jgi:hypothetical protein
MPELAFECTSIDNVSQYYSKYSDFSISNNMCKPQCRSINSVWRYYSQFYGFSISKYTCKPQWSLGKHCVLVTFCMPTRPKWTGAALLGCECRMYARSNRSWGLNLPGISLLQFRNISQVYWHSLREPHEIHKSSMPGGMPPAITSCKVRTTLSQCSQNAVKYSYQNIFPIENVWFQI